MAYSTQADLEQHASADALLQLTDRAQPPAGAIDAAIVAAALDDATGIVEGYLRARYALPLDPIPAEIVRYTTHIAFYLLHGNAQVYPEAVKADYEAALARLKDIAKGLALLSSAAPAAPASLSQSAEYDGAERLFTRDSMRAF